MPPVNRDANPIGTVASPKAAALIVSRTFVLLPLLTANKTVCVEVIGFEYVVQQRDAGHPIDTAAFQRGPAELLRPKLLIFLPIGQRAV